ncbi:MAG: DUF3127 domain-containing protein [Bacteroidota bacterium]
MDITGKIIEVLPTQTGNSQKGEWKKQLFILETNDQFPKTVCFENWNDKIDLSIDTSNVVKVYFDLDSREYNGKWYTNIRAWKMDIVDKQEKSNPMVPPKTESGDNPPWANEQDSDLPF